ncbi:MAG TPA: hypothetical protein VGN52_16780 [Burkholderiales bacterium]|jgi:hypothetical protein
MYAKCPKCGHAPLPANQAMPAACPACGIILAKFGVAKPDVRMAPRAASAVAASSLPPALTMDQGEPGQSGRWAHFRSLLVHVPDEVSDVYWYGRAATLAIVALWSVFLFKDTHVASGAFASNFLHGILLIFHEAGHVIFMLFGRFITTLGGSLNQVLVPLIVAGSLLIQRRDPFGAALFIWLAGFSVVDVAIYMYDAFDPQMPLLGGGTGADRDSHDWQNLFGDMGLLRHARGIGMGFAALGWSIMLAALAWGACLLRKQWSRRSDNPFAEENR